MLPPRGRVRVVAALLAGVAGFGDAVGFLALFGVFTAHMSGNTTHLGVSLADGAWTDAAIRFFPIPMFVLAIAIGTATVEVVRRRPAGRERLAALLIAEAVLLVAFMVITAWARDADALRPASAAFFALAGVLTLVMGLQTAVLRRVGGLTVHTTFISGMLTQAAVGGVAWWFERRDARRVGAPRPRGDADGPGGHALLALAVWACFGLGAVVGALGHRVVDEWALALPAVVLVGLAAVAPSLERPAAEPGAASSSSSSRG